MYKLKCIKESKRLYIFKKDTQYCAVRALVDGEPVLTINEGVFQLVLHYDTSTESWKNSREDVEFVFIGEAEHY